VFALACAGAQGAISTGALVFASDRADDLGRSRVYSVGVDGTGLTPLSEGVGDEESLAVSRGRERIAFLRTVAGDTNVWVANADGLAARQITHTREPKVDLAWAPSGRRLAFAVCPDAGCRRGIEVVNADGTGLRRIANDGLAPSWSPSGTRIVFAGETQSYGDPSAIDVVSVDGGPVRRIAPLGSAPSWSPGGGWVEFQGGCGRGGSVCVVRPNGRDRHAVADGSDAAWSPRGNRLAVTGKGLGVVSVAKALHVHWLVRAPAASPAWSPDGRRIVYVEGAATTPLAIVSIRARGGGRHVVRVEPPTSTLQGLSFSRDGTRVTYRARLESNDHDLYLLRPGEKPQQLTRTFMDERDPAWSPDGTQIAFVRSGIWAMRADGRQQHRLTASADTDPAWSPDGSKLVFIRRAEAATLSDVVVLEVATGVLSTLPLPPAAYAAPAWSPDGTQIALVAAGKVSLMRPDGSDLHAVAPAAGYGPSWSPDGREIAYIHQARGGVFTLDVVDVVTGAVRTVANGPDPDGGRTAWSRDGAEIAFTRNRDDGGLDIYAVATDGSGERRITDAPTSNVDPSWGP
jgi:Tol biopolymer transport system component